MRRIRFIHAADLHLGSVLHLAGEGQPSNVEEAVEMVVFLSFQRLCQLALDEEVDFIVISGDLYDREARSVQAQKIFAEECGRLEQKGIGVYLIAGNHDPLREKQELFTLPDNVHVFRGDQPEVHLVFDSERRPLARIVGQSYQGRSECKALHLNYPVLDKDLWNVALLHTQLEPGNSNYVPCSLGELKARTDIHYWALGHIHQSRILNDVHPLIAYPGIPQGRDFGERGQGGCFLVELGDPRAERVVFKELATVIYKRLDVFLDQDSENQPETLEDVLTFLKKEAKQLMQAEQCSGGYVVEWILRGRLDLHRFFKEQEGEVIELLIGQMNETFSRNTPFLWTDAIFLRTAERLDLDELFAQNSILEEIDALREQFNQAVFQKEIRQALGEIWRGSGETEEGGQDEDFLFYLDDALLRDFWNRARQLILEKLAERREL